MILGMVCLLFFVQAGRGENPDTLKYVDASQFELIGKGFTDTETRYERLPAHLKGVTRGPVWSLSKNCSGLAIRFRTNSKVVAAKWTVTGDNVMNHFAPSGIKGLDLYCLEKGKWQFVNSARPSGKSSSSRIISHMTATEREFMLFLPLYDGLSHLEIGVEPDALLENPLVDSPGKASRWSFMVPASRREDVLPGRAWLIPISSQECSTGRLSTWASAETGNSTWRSRV